jgi:formylglycine-generating enzyme required for sulfatase activity
MGSDDHYPEEAPAHRVRVGGFGIDPVAVTNRRFAEFVAATGYVTVAERPLDPAQFPVRPRRTSSPARWSSPPHGDR